VSAGGRIIFWCETYTRDEKKNEDEKEETKKNEGTDKKKSESEANATAATNGKKEEDKKRDKSKKKKEYMRLCWSELWFEEVSRPTNPTPGPGFAKPPSYNAREGN
jgi:hypothetical protein